MYLKTDVVVWTSFERTASGKQKQRKRTRKEYVLRCDSCQNDFRRTSAGFDPKRANDSFHHYCDDCDSRRMAQKLGVKSRLKNLELKIGEKTFDSHGYVRVYVGNTHPYSEGYCGAIREHVMVMENHLGRALTKGEVVHHINGDKADNDISNLDLCTVQEHNACHASSENIIFDLYKRGLVKYSRETKRYYLNENC